MIACRDLALDWTEEDMDCKQQAGAGDPPTALYLLRVWRVEGRQDPPLRAALKASTGSEWVGFASLEAMVAALRDGMEQDGGTVAEE